MRLGVNIDHIATLRQARLGIEPEPLYAALIAQEALADNITMHLREDRRHIQESDVIAAINTLKIPVNLEMSIADDIVKFALEEKPYQSTLVPEKRKELTTEGGLDVISNFEKLKEVTDKLHSKNILVSLFIDPDKKQIEAAKKLNVDSIEIHTGEFAKAPYAQKFKFASIIADAAVFAKSLGLNVHAGHGLNYQNVSLIAKIKEIEELNIGHSIISRAVFCGLKEAILQMKQIIEKARWSV
ncbi:MAG TPA: pyridoxine 5'-phosphate synthase [Desulfurella acetivorans]|uniref:Pyridoxine 5'-phosphate synthase n=1 Tax=Desulfurella acetivorans TaxID=33002 RepID=A0A7C6A721_DESAE|nr:pyridoxine 5'-phosphate synthase [Desulfurella acetivorans]